MIRRELCRSRPALVCGRPDHATRHHHAQRRDVPPIGFGVERAQDRLGERIPDDRHAVDAVLLHRVEQLDGIEVAPGHRDDGPAEREVPHRVERPRAVHQRCSGQVARPWLRHARVVRVPARRVGERLPRCRVEASDQIVLSPHHALRHAGGPAGEQDVEVVRRPAPGCGDPLRSGRGGRLVRHRPVRARTAAVVDPDPQPHLGRAGAHRCAALGEGAVEDHRLGVGVAPQVRELVVGVPVVGVDRHEAALNMPNMLSRYSGQL